MRSGALESAREATIRDTMIWCRLPPGSWRALVDRWRRSRSMPTLARLTCWRGCAAHSQLRSHYGGGSRPAEERWPALRSPPPDSGFRSASCTTFTADPSSTSRAGATQRAKARCTDVTALQTAGFSSRRGDRYRGARSARLPARNRGGRRGRPRSMALEALYQHDSLRVAHASRVRRRLAVQPLEKMSALRDRETLQQPGAGSETVAFARYPAHPSGTRNQAHPPERGSICRTRR